nr:DNA internalization-related competence protein ComEC/Rec2 [Kofleriaceae bacterium]
AVVVIAARRRPQLRLTGWLCWLLLGVGLVRWQRAPALSVADLRTVVTVQGAVTSVERTAPPDGVASYRVVVRTETQLVEVRSAQQVWPGDQVAVHGRLRAPRALNNPGNHGRVLADGARGIDGVMTAPRMEIVGYRWTLGRVVAHWHQAWRATLDRSIPAGPGRAVTAGVVLGDRWEFDDAMNQRWRDAGVFHALSVSGLHLVVVAFGTLGLLRRVVALLPVGQRLDPVRLAAAPALLAALGYTLLTGGQVATWRAMLAVTLVIAARVAHVRVAHVRVWGVVAMLMMVVAPLQVFDPSFQLTFCATYVLIALPSEAPIAVDKPARWQRLLRWLGQSFRASVWVTLLTAPITAFHFQQVAIAGVVANLLVLPLIELLVIPGALLALLGASVWPELGDAVLPWVGQVARAANALTSYIAAWAPVGHIGLAHGVAAASAVAGLGWLLARQRRSVADLVVVAVVITAWSLGVDRRDSATLRVTFLDVGQGDAAIVETPGNKVWLIDAGGFPNRDGIGKTASGDAVVRALRARGIHHIDDVWISHPHPDHYLGLLRVVAQLPVRRLWLPVGFDEAAGEFGQVVAQLGAYGVQIRRPPLGLVAAEPGLTLRLLAPRYDRGDLAVVLAASDPVRTVNDNSAVLLLEYAERRVLFLGDIEHEGEMNLLTALPVVDVVKVAHHGSRTSSDPDLVEVVRPAIAVISCGFANPFGFPHPEVLARWQQAGSRVLRTDQDGAITVQIAPDGALAWRREVATWTSR